MTSSAFALLFMMTIVRIGSGFSIVSSSTGTTTIGYQHHQPYHPTFFQSVVPFVRRGLVGKEKNVASYENKKLDNYNNKKFTVLRATMENGNDEDSSSSSSSSSSESSSSSSYNINEDDKDRSSSFFTTKSNQDKQQQQLQQNQKSVLGFNHLSVLLYQVMENNNNNNNNNMNIPLLPGEQQTIWIPSQSLLWNNYKQQQQQRDNDDYDDSDNNNNNNNDIFFIMAYCFLGRNKNHDTITTTTTTTIYEDDNMYDHDDDHDDDDELYIMELASLCRVNHPTMYQQQQEQQQLQQDGMFVTVQSIGRIQLDLRLQTFEDYHHQQQQSISQQQHDYSYPFMTGIMTGTTKYFLFHELSGGSLPKSILIAKNIQLLLQNISTMEQQQQQRSKRIAVLHKKNSNRNNKDEDCDNDDDDDSSTTTTDSSSLTIWERYQIAYQRFQTVLSFTTTTTTARTTATMMCPLKDLDLLQDDDNDNVHEEQINYLTAISWAVFTTFQIDSDYDDDDDHKTIMKNKTTRNNEYDKNVLRGTPLVEQRTNHHHDAEEEQEEEQNKFNSIIHKYRIRAFDWDNLFERLKLAQYMLREIELKLQGRKLLLLLLDDDDDDDSSVATISNTSTKDDNNNNGDGDSVAWQ